MPDYLHQDPVPQDRAALAKQRAERLARARATTVVAYAKVGARDPKWDRAAIAALDKAAVAQAGDHRDSDAVVAAAEALTEAVGLGCTDPLVTYLQVRVADKRAPGQFAAATVVAAKGLRDSRYPAVRRAHAAHHCAFGSAKPPTTAAEADAVLASADFVVVRELVREAWRDDPVGTPDDFVELAGLAQAFCQSAPGGRDRAYAAFAAALDALPDADATRLWMKGRYLLNRGWATRGQDAAGATPAADMRAFEADIRAAQIVLERAWDADPTRAEIAVCLMEAAGPQDLGAVEKWFREAMRADGDCLRACQTKGNFLHRKRGGHSDAVRQFAERLAATENWDAFLPQLGATLVMELNIQPIPDADWAFVERTFDSFLAARPDSRWGWSRLALLAWQTGRHATALRAADKLDGRPLTDILPQQPYDEIRAGARTTVAAGHK